MPAKQTFWPSTQGLTNGGVHPLYNTWQSMMHRCYNPRHTSDYKRYGGRGITVCERWHNARVFIEDIERLLGPRPDGATLDRYPDNNGDYEPGNVRWASRTEQNRNTRVFIDGNRKGHLYQLWNRLMRVCPSEVCEHWHDFPVFAKELAQLLGPRPAGLRFHRLDDSRPYEPGNVAWVTPAKQIERAVLARAATPYDVKHGLYEHPLYKSWRLAARYPDRWHEPWRDVTTFIAEVEAELGPKPDGMAFRLTDPDGRYEPGNICWGKRGRPPRR